VNGKVDFQYLERRVDFSLCLVQFDEGEIIRPHDHPGMTGMILCASGEIETSNYDPIDLFAYVRIFTSLRATGRRGRGG
jgi:cysteamine dioxygenase